MLAHYNLDGSIYQAPQLCNVFAARIGWALYHTPKAFTTAVSKLEKIGYVDAENENMILESKVGKEAIDFKEVMRVDQILTSLQRKLPLAPPSPQFSEEHHLRLQRVGHDSQNLQVEQTSLAPFLPGHAWPPLVWATVEPRVPLLYIHANF